MNDLGDFHYFLRIFPTRSSTFLFLSQHKYAIDILEHASMINCKFARTPIDLSARDLMALALLSRTLLYIGA